MKLADTYKALGDPVRLKMVERLSKNPAYTLGALSKGLGVTRQGARKHLVILENARIVRLVPGGRETKVLLNGASLNKASSFISELGRAWDVRLEALRAFSEQHVESQDL
ncbi:MAG: HTH-type transcriptional regulator [Candidatus Kaiserbacteria bacterium]|nr:HTH-type transcriptional regulator [Candidatus Kaiserbacteria bacterium]